MSDHSSNAMPFEGLEIFGIEELEARQEMSLLSFFAEDSGSEERTKTSHPASNSVKGCAIFGRFSRP